MVFSTQKRNNNDMIKVLANATVVIILQYINVSNQHYYTHQTYIMSFVNYISIQLNTKRKIKRGGGEGQGDFPSAITSFQVSTSLPSPNPLWYLPALGHSLNGLMPSGRFLAFCPQFIVVICGRIRPQSSYSVITRPQVYCNINTYT